MGIKHKIQVTVDVVIHEAEEGGYWGEVPSLPGCCSQGETREELLRNMAEAATLYLDSTKSLEALKRKALARAKQKAATTVDSSLASKKVAQIDDDEL